MEFVLTILIIAVLELIYFEFHFEPCVSMEVEIQCLLFHILHLRTISLPPNQNHML